MGAALVPAPDAKQEDRHVGTALLLGGVPLLHLHAQRVDRHRASGVFAVAFLGRRRIMLVVMVAGVMLSLVAFPTILQTLRGPRHIDERRGLRVELAVMAVRLLGRGAPARELGPDHRHRAQHELAGDRPAEGAAQRLPALVRRDGHHRDHRVPGAAHQHGSGRRDRRCDSRRRTAVELRAISRGRIRSMRHRIRAPQHRLQRDHRRWSCSGITSPSRRPHMRSRGTARTPCSSVCPRRSRKPCRSRWACEALLRRVGQTPYHGENAGDQEARERAGQPSRTGTRRSDLLGRTPLTTRVRVRAIRRVGIAALAGLCAAGAHGRDRCAGARHRHHSHAHRGVCRGTRHRSRWSPDHRQRGDQRG